MFVCHLETDIWISFAEPVAGLLDGLVEGSELEVRKVLAEFVVASGLLELTVRSGSVEDPLSGEAVGLGDCLGGLLDGDLLGLGDGENDWLGLFVLAHHPEEKSGQIDRVDKLTTSLTSSPNGEWFVLGGASVELVDQAGDDVGLFKVEVVVWTENVGWDDGSELLEI